MFVLRRRCRRRGLSIWFRVIYGVGRKRFSFVSAAMGTGDVGALFATTRFTGNEVDSG